ncbi:MAG: aa3-type cytochrome c oxidase subunit IV [Pseudomonadota bacterium]
MTVVRYCFVALQEHAGNKVAGVRAGIESPWPLGYQALKYGISSITSWGFAMSIDTSEGHEAMDYKEHTRTYNGFITGTILLTGFVVLVLIGMAIFLL